MGNDFREQFRKWCASYQARNSEKPEDELIEEDHDVISVDIEAEITKEFGDGFDDDVDEGLTTGAVAGYKQPLGGNKKMFRRPWPAMTSEDYADMQNMLRRGSYWADHVMKIYASTLNYKTSQQSDDKSGRENKNKRQ